MANVSVFDMTGKQVGTRDLSDEIFGIEPNMHLVYMAVRLQMANKRQGTQSAKTRSEVSGGGKKPYRQKGTGRARQGSTRAPQWTHGGIVFAPKPRSYSFKMNKKEKRIALKSVLSAAAAEEKFILVDEIKMDAPKTKDFQAMLDALNVRKALVILDQKDEAVLRSARNIEGIKTAYVNTINVYDILKYQTVVATSAAVTQMEEVYNG
ncbi:MAG: 50S ribosomal protein L4 [Lachnospiraceae bacterium]|nr:50S ribosomal protein L4 [Lachnospiraceae bacterium]MBQ1515165.1 50S ribosomal protein L4 [Lachnospiraceae bacterium]MCR5538015.1 50S ribosomal protein L4 [Lachnospiraceae bacterium]